MESSTPDPAAGIPEPDAGVEPVGTPPVAVPEPVPVVPSLSLDHTVVDVPSAPDLDAITTSAPAATSAAQQPDFDLWDSGSYATTLAQEGYGQPAAAAPSGPVDDAGATGYQQPGLTPYAQTAPSAQTGQYPQAPYAQPDPYAQANPYAQAGPYAGQHPYAPVPYVPTQPGTLNPDEERTWASAAHWSALVASLVGLGFVGPLLVYLIQGPKSAWVKAQAAESLSFEITYIISMIASVIGLFFFVGWVTIFLFPLLWLIFRILAAVATSQGRDYRYPVNIRMVK